MTLGGHEEDRYRGGASPSASIRVCCGTRVPTHVRAWARARARVMCSHVCAAHEIDTPRPRRNMRGRHRERAREHRHEVLLIALDLSALAMSWTAWIIAARVADSTGVDHPAVFDLFLTYINR